MNDYIKVYEPRVNVKSSVEQSKIVYMGGSRIAEQTHVADSSQTSPQIPIQSLFTVYPNNPRTIVDRYIKVRSYIEVTCDQPHQLGTNDALRSFPMNSVIETTTCTTNGFPVAENTGDDLHALKCYGNSVEDRSRSVSMTPAQPDSYQEYSDWTTYGSARNPLANYGENSAEPSRGGFVYEVVSPTVFRAVVTEPLMLSPFFDGNGHQEEGLVNVNQLNVSLRYKSDLSRVMSHASTGNAITTVGMTFYRAPELLVVQITPDVLQPIPELQVLPYFKKQTFIKQLPTLTAGQTNTNIISDTIKLNQVPRYMYLFCKHSRATSDFKTSDSFLSLKNLQLFWNSEQLFSSTSQQELFEISRRNGCNLDWPSFSKYRGSVICIDFGGNLGLPDGQAPGVRGQFTLQVNGLQGTNESSEDFTPEFYMVFQLEGTMSISEGVAMASLGNLDTQDVLEARDAPELSHLDYQKLQGGSFLSSLKNIVSKVSHGVESALPVAKLIAGVSAPEFLPALGMVGQVAKVGKCLTGGRLAGGRLAGGRLAGGAVRRR
tara:strand:+ start:20 stop:1654 length:1635 start_codon:yes stop_codon:yes gene_type:complete